MNSKMKKTIALSAFLGLLVATPGFGQGFILNPLTGPFRAKDVDVEVLRRTPTAPESVSSLVQDNGLPISMNDMVRLTLENSFDLGMQRFSPLLAEYSIAQARAEWDPSISLSGSVSRSRSTSTRQTDGADVSTNLSGSYSASFSQSLKTGGNYSVGASLSRRSSNDPFNTFNPSWSGSMSYSFSQPLLRGFGIRLNTASLVTAENSVESARISFEQTVMDAVLQAQNAYYDLINAVETIRVRQNALDLSQRTLNENRLKVDIGTMAEIDLAQSELDLANQELSLVTSQNSLRQVEDNIKSMITRIADPGMFLVSLRPTTRIENVNPTVLPLAEAIELAYRIRPDMRQFELDLENNELSMMQSKNNLLPSLNLSLRYGHSGTAGTRIVRDGLGGDITERIPGGFNDLWPDMFSFDQANYSVGFSLSFPIGNRAAQTNYARQVISSRQLESRREILMQSIAMEVRNAYEDVLTAQRQMDIAERGYAVAQLSLNGEQRRFELGQSSLRFVIQEQNNLTSSEVSLLNQRIALVRALAAYDRSIGRTLELNNVRIEDEYRPNLAGDAAPGVASRD